MIIFFVQNKPIIHIVQYLLIFFFIFCFSQPSKEITNSDEELQVELKLTADNIEMVENASSPPATVSTSGVSSNQHQSRSSEEQQDQHERSASSSSSSSSSSESPSVRYYFELFICTITHFNL